MKFTSKNVIPSNSCLSYKCKICPKQLECDKKELKANKRYEAEPLLYKPFENLKEILNERNKMH